MNGFMKELKVMKIWFLWQWKSGKNGKPTKVPISANGTSTGTSSEWSHTWVAYDEAVGAVEAQHAAGVGFKVPEGYFFLDADHYSLEDPFIQLVLDRFNSYTERSVSGGGLHIYGKCDIAKLPIVYDANGKAKLDRAYYTKNPNNNLELYIGGLTNRFAVFTGDVVVEQPLKECTSAVLVTLDKNMRRAEKKRYSENRDGDKVTFDIICNLRKQKNGDKFRRLFDEGDISDYGTHSEADAALCSLIAFRTGDDVALICIEGYGPTQIAKILAEEKIPVPTAHLRSLGINTPARVPDDIYTWQTRTVSDILQKHEYLGHTINFKTYKKSYKSKKKLWNDPSEWQVFENTHEAIIDEETFRIVQRIRDGRRKVTRMGEMPILSGMLFCADCGKKLYQVRCTTMKQKEYMVCSTYRKVKGGCSSHQIQNETIETLILDGIRGITAFAREHETEFVELVTKKCRADVDKTLRDSKRELEQSQARIKKLDEIIQRLYEDNIEGKISDERFSKMTANYEVEQKTLESRTLELKDIINSEKENYLNADRFLKLVRKHTDIKELTAEILREFVEKVYVYQSERVNGKRVQRIKIIYNCIGDFQTPPTEHEKTA